MKETTLVYFRKNLAGASPGLFFGGSTALSPKIHGLPEHAPVRTTVEGERCCVPLTPTTWAGEKKEGKNEENGTENERLDFNFSFLALL